MVALLTRIIVAIVTLSFMISGSYYDDTTAEYFRRLGKIDTFENSTLTAIPAKNVHDIFERHFSSPLPEGKKVKKAIFIGYDGVRVDTFTDLDSHESSAIKTLTGEGGHAYLSFAGGINFPYYNIQATDSAPGWTSMLTGELYYKTGVLWNGYEKDEKYPTLLKSLIDDDLADKTSFYSSWGDYIRSTLNNEVQTTAADGYDANYIAADQYLEGKEYTDKYEALDTISAELAIQDIQDENCSDFIFTLFESTDEAGHNSGFHPTSEKYMKAFALEDRLAQNIIDAIKARPTYEEEDWLILLTTDHGGFNRAHGYCTAMERYTFIALSQELMSKDTSL